MTAALNPNLDYVRRLAQKPFATAAELAIYREIDGGRVGIEVGGRIFLLDREDEQESLDAEERKEAKSAHLYWDDNSNTPIKDSCPDVVDHRAQQSSVKDQLDRGTCVCFASLANLEALILAQQEGVTLSEQYANWLFMRMQGRDQCDDTLKTTLAARYLTQYGVCEESSCLYEDLPTVLGHCTSDPSVQAKKCAQYGIGQYALIDRIGLFGPSIANTDYVEAILCHGHDIVFGTGVAWGYPDANGVYDVIRDQYGNTKQVEGGHSMVMVGFDRSVEVPYIIAKNSWGTGVGVNGYYYLSYDYIRTYARYGYIVQQINTDMPTAP